MLVCRRVRADLRVLILTVLLPEMALDFALRAVEGATSLGDTLWMEVVGSRMGREDVEGSCSWVAMVHPSGLIATPKY